MKLSDDIIDFMARGFSAEELIRFRPNAKTRRRVASLLERDRRGALDENEQEELNSFVQAELILGLAKARAQALLSRSA